MYFALPVPFSSSFVSPVTFFPGEHTLLYLDEIDETIWRKEGCLFVCLFIFFLMWGIDILGSNAYEQIVSTGFFRNCRVMYDLTYLPNVRHKTPEKPGDGEFFYPLEVHSYLSPVLLYEKWNWGPGKFQQYFNIPRFIPLHHIYIV